MIGRLMHHLRNMAGNADIRPRPSLPKARNAKPDLAKAPLEKPAPTSNVKETAKPLHVPETSKENAGSLNTLPPEFDEAAFFAVLRGGPLRHRSPSQVIGTEAILKAMEGAPLAWTAYALATAWHETAFTMQPIKEKGGRAYFMRMYDKTGNRPHVAEELGNTVVGDGATFAGRGYVQLTGRRNYQKAERKIGEPFVSNPDLAMRPDLAARIMREGMTEGWFTGRGFVHFLPSTGPASQAAFTQARRIINGMDRAAKIAGEALAFQAALIGGCWK